MAGVLTICTACGGLKRTSSSGTTSTKKSEKLSYEHEAMKPRKSPWKATKTVEEKGENETADLTSFIKEWEGTPHVMGGNTKKGVDCSGFVIQCYLQVYEKEFLGRRAEDLFGETRPVKRKNLREGDLVFFKVNGRRIDHVGVYIGDDDFVHTSSSRGVMVSNLNQAYWDKRFFMGGRKD